MKRVGQLRNALIAEGLQVMGNPSAIVPVVVGDEALARMASRRLPELGVVANLVEYPAVAKGNIEAAMAVNFQWGTTIPEMSATLIPYFLTDLEKIKRFPASDARKDDVPGPGDADRGQGRWSERTHRRDRESPRSRPACP